MKGINCHFHLNEDLAIGILLRLPVKSLLRFKSVCKAWHAIISSPSFIRKHFHREGNSISLLAYWSGNRYNPELFEINGTFYDYFDEFTMFRGEFLERCEDADHIELPGHIFRMRGPCNGIFCLRHSNGKIALWNPATRRLHEVPNCPLHWNVHCVFDFGIDPLTGDLKIILISGIDIIQEFAIYNLSNNSWSLRNQNFVQAAGYSVVTESNCYGPTFSGGFCYWMKRNAETYHLVILAFDLHNELFQELDMPTINLLESRVVRQLELHTINRESRVKRQLYWYNDSLALLTYQSFAGETHVDIWSMKEHGYWTKVWNFSLPFMKVTSIGVWMNNKIYAVTSDWELVICHTRTGKSKNLEFRRMEYASDVVLFAFPYKESLFSP